MVLEVVKIGFVGGGEFLLFFDEIFEEVDVVIGHLEMRLGGGVSLEQLLFSTLPLLFQSLQLLLHILNIINLHELLQLKHGHPKIITLHDPQILFHRDISVVIHLAQKHELIP